MQTVDKIVGPTFTDDPLIKRSGLAGPGKLKGKLFKLSMSSKDSKIYPGVIPVKNAFDILPKLHEDCEIYDTFGGIENFTCRVATEKMEEISKPHAYKRPVEVFVPQVLMASRILGLGTGLIRTVSFGLWGLD